MCWKIWSTELGIIPCEEGERERRKRGLNTQETGSSKERKRRRERGQRRDSGGGLSLRKCYFGQRYRHHISEAELVKSMGYLHSDRRTPDSRWWEGGIFRVVGSPGKPDRSSCRTPRRHQSCRDPARAWCRSAEHMEAQESSLEQHCGALAFPVPVWP